jgi:hypothetical protein
MVFCSTTELALLAAWHHQGLDNLAVNVACQNYPDHANDLFLSIRARQAALDANLKAVH